MRSTHCLGRFIELAVVRESLENREVSIVRLRVDNQMTSYTYLNFGRSV